MAIKRSKPTSPGRRHWSMIDYKKEVTTTVPEKSLLETIRRTGGRNNHGHLTMRHIGGGAYHHYRKIDFKRNKDGIEGTVKTIERDPNRSCLIALVCYADGEKRYILAPNGLKVGAKIMSGAKAEPKVGNAMPLELIPVGLEIHNVELFPGKGGVIARSAGNVARLMAREGEHATVVLPSGEMRKVPIKCRATIGTVGNADHQHTSVGSAGRHRRMGVRPTVRGSCQNPVSHPMGGGEGRRSGGRHPVSKWGVLAKGGITRKNKKSSNKLILRGRKKRIEN
jgi:large subunit ribosomal protein L2